MTPRDLLEGESLLRGEMDRTRRAMGDSVSTFHERCRAQLFDPLQRIVDDLREAHDRLLVETPFEPSEGGDGEGGGAQDWHTIRRYVEGVGRTVMEPAARELASVRATSILDSLGRSLQEDLTSVARGSPVTIRRPEPPDLYAPAPGDPLPWRVGKGMVRARRSVRRVVGTLPTPNQDVPLRTLLAGHIGERVLVLVLAVTEELHQSLARPLLSLEESLTRWVRDFPPAEDRIDSPACHVAEDMRSLLAAVEVPRGGEDQGRSAAVEDEQTLPEAPAQDPAGVPGVAEVARELQAALEAFQGSSLPAEEIAEGFKAELARAWDVLEGEVLRSGSFMARSTKEDSSEPLPATSPRAEAWEEWHRQSRNRHRLNSSLCTFRSEWMLILDRLVEGVGREGLAAHLTGADEAIARLEEIRARSESIFAGARVSDAPRLAEEVEKLLEIALGDLRRTFLDSFQEEPWPTRVRAAGDRASEEFARLISKLPSGLRVHAAQGAEGGEVIPESQVVEIHLREIAEQAMDVFRLESVRASPGALLESLVQKRDEAGEIASILEFNLDSARKELADIEQMEGNPAEIIADARSLTDSGITLTAQALRDLRVGLAKEWEPFVRGAHDLVVRPYREIQERSGVTGSVEEQLLDLRARTSEWLRLRQKEAGESARRATTSLRRGMGRAGVRLSRLVRMGRAVVGTAPITREEAERTLEIIVGLPGFLAGLPQAYQRLFSFDPVSDPGMLVGRVDDLEWIRRRLEGHRSELSGPILITGPTGVGRSSLLNVVRATACEGIPVREIDLTERIRDEATLSALLAETFEVPGKPPPDLTQLEDALVETSAEAGPLVAVVERMEHLFLRVPSGTDLLERLVCLQAATSSRILWISTMGQIAWKQVSTQELRIKGLLDVRSVSPLDRAGMEEVIMGRHRRSGLPARFEEPRDPNPILRRKLRRAREDRERQDLLRDDFFDRLYRASDSSIPMAIFLWLRAADFEARDGVAHIHPVEPLRMGYLHQDLDMSLFFSLKAFLEHGSLTMEEHSEIFRVTHDESFQIFTALRGQLLLEPLTVGTSARSDRLPPTEQRPGYRVPPLLTQTVIQHLTNRNIVH